MALTRRQFIAAAAGSLIPRAGWTRTTLSLGALQIDTLSDGHLVLPASFTLGGIPVEDAAPILARYGLGTDRIEPPCNVTLVRDGTNTVLFDVGSGPNFMPSAGKLPDALDAMDLAPEDITHVVITHAHPDHIWGLLDDFDDPLFADAEYLIGKDEFDYWIDPDTVNTIAPARQSFAVGARTRLQAIEDAVTVFGDGEEILPGIAARATYGHTPGHMSFEVGAGPDAALILGDAVVNHHLAFERPGWASGSDQDPDLGAATRQRLLGELADRQMTLVGFHLPGGGIGRAERTGGDSYRFVTEDM